LVGIAISGTALAVKVKILTDLGLLRSRVGYIMMGASVTDNLQSFIILTAVLKGITGKFTPWGVGVSILEVAVVLAIGYFVYPRVGKVMRTEMRVFTLALLMGFLFAVLAERIGIHFIIGAYLAGLFVREQLQEREFRKIDLRFETIAYGLLAPIFIVSLAFHVKLEVFITEFWFLIGLFLAAVGGKLIGSGGLGYLAGLGKDEALTVGIGGDRDERTRHGRNNFGGGGCGNGNFDGRSFDLAGGRRFPHHLDNSLLAEIQVAQVEPHRV